MKFCPTKRNQENNDSVTIYWAPASFPPEVASFNMLYPKPKRLSTKLVAKKTDNFPHPSSCSYLRCPAYAEFISNIFTFDSAVTCEIPLNPKWETNTDFPKEGHVINGVPYSILLRRPSWLEGYYNTELNISWFFFSEDNVNFRITAPYFPALLPAPDVLLAAGEVPLGEWGVRYHLDYHVPNGTKSLKFEIDRPLIYFEVFTDKKVNFVRFKPTNAFANLMHEMRGSFDLYGTRTFADRFKMAKNAGMKALIMNEIRPNVISDSDD